MLNDPIVLEIRKHREAYAASLGYDLERIVADLQSRQGQDGRTVVDRTSVEVSPHNKAQAGSLPPVSSSDSTRRSR